MAEDGETAAGFGGVWEDVAFIQECPSFSVTAGTVAAVVGTFLLSFVLLSVPPGVSFSLGPHAESHPTG